MGLTIHYEVQFRGSKQALIAGLTAIREKCRDLPFEEVDEVEQKEITLGAIRCWQNHQSSPEHTVEQRDRDMALYGLDAWDIIEAINHDDTPCLQPTFLIGLYLWPGKGCEDSSLRFYKRQRQQVWRCDAFCKTQYAEHFVRCHLLVVTLMDIVKATEGFTVQVSDEGEYWETRNIETLAENINASTAMIKGVLGSLQQSLPDGATIEANISKSENYIKTD